MKVNITYQHGEEKQAGIIVKCIKAVLIWCRVRISDKHPPHHHIYISKEPPRETGED